MPTKSREMVRFNAELEPELDKALEKALREDDNTKRRFLKAAVLSYLKRREKSKK